MSEQSPSVETSEPQSPSPSSTTTSTQSTDTRNANIRAVIGFASIAIMGCFFLPWITLFFGTLSGFDLQKLPGSTAELVWFIPGGAALALLAVVGKQAVTFASQLAGVIPFIALVYYRLQMGEGFFNALQYGAYLTLGLAALLFVLPHFFKKRPQP